MVESHKCFWKNKELSQLSVRALNAIVLVRITILVVIYQVLVKIYLT